MAQAKKFDAATDTAFGCRSHWVEKENQVIGKVKGPSNNQSCAGCFARSKKGLGPTSVKKKLYKRDNFLP